ncbi:Rck2p [Saccharomyces cerevisiae x Saccharomyces kudriavzevii VIN7]|uniref:non-specific serine/threonine protein kinase n=1 Tax=Saccharomyces cerevisiae x Saccharomyces kudriavzevii (strain VIN7) TaxID=1095631 RepID=H0GYG5_SACCK|nr:Rck2p [Saccharomyces cerevisiae x Saccharomyces kudriavzevii VIN7]
MLKIKALFSKKKPDQADLSQGSKKALKGKTRSNGTTNKDVSEDNSFPKKRHQDRNVMHYSNTIADDHHMKSLTDELVTTIDSDSSPSDNITTENIETVTSVPAIDVHESNDDEVSYDPLMSDESLPIQSETISDIPYGDTDDENLEDETPEKSFLEQKELIGYRLINKIGEGAFSKVFRAIPAKNSSNEFLTKNYKAVAIKVIKKADLSSINGDHRKKDKGKDSTKTSSRDQVLKEVALHKTVSADCSQIVAFIDFQETNSYYYIIQELLTGGEIFGEIVRLTYFSEDLSRHVIKQLALAVKHMHSLGVVHRDIKPENLLFEPIEFTPSVKQKFRKSDDPQTKADEGIFTPDIGGGGIGVVKLADFGLSKQIFSKNTKTPCGTVGYTAPEVVKDEHYSMKVDMWGIGCVLYTMLCGFPPFYDEKIDTLTEKISRGEYTFLKPWWDEISPGAKNAVVKLLELEPSKRYDIDQLLDDPWLNSYDCLPKERESSQKKAGTSERRHMHKNNSNYSKRTPRYCFHQPQLLCVTHLILVTQSSVLKKIVWGPVGAWAPFLKTKSLKIITMVAQKMNHWNKTCSN